MPAAPRPAKTRRVEINMPEELWEAIQQYRIKRKMTMTEAILRALGSQFEETYNAVVDFIDEEKASSRGE